MKQKLDRVTLVAVATKEVEETLKALRYSTLGIEFAEVLLLADFNPDPNASDFRYETIKPFGDVGEWGRFIVFELYKHIKTDFILLVHADGFVVNPHKWDDDFLQYDYIGSPWPLPKDKFSFRDEDGNIVRVGNSVSIRSKKLLSLPKKLNLNWDMAAYGYFHEDGFVCAQHKKILESNGIKFAPLNLAARFGREKEIPENKYIEPFVFHKWMGKNKKYPSFGKNKSEIINRCIKIFKRVISNWL